MVSFRPISFQGIASDERCSICQESFQVDQEIVTHGNVQGFHPFHKECIVRWITQHPTCPVCRVAVFPESLMSKQEVCLSVAKKVAVVAFDLSLLVFFTKRVVSDVHQCFTSASQLLLQNDSQNGSRVDESAYFLFGLYKNRCVKRSFSFFLSTGCCVLKKVKRTILSHPLLSVAGIVLGSCWGVKG